MATDAAVLTKRQYPYYPYGVQPHYDQNFFPDGYPNYNPVQPLYSYPKNGENG
jgi:hypothetical protein